MAGGARVPAVVVSRLVAIILRSRVVVVVSVVFLPLIITERVIIFIANVKYQLLAPTIRRRPTKMYNEDVRRSNAAITHSLCKLLHAVVVHHYEFDSVELCKPVQAPIETRRDMVTTTMALGVIWGRGGGARHFTEVARYRSPPTRLF